MAVVARFVDIRLAPLGVLLAVSGCSLDAPPAATQRVPPPSRWTGPLFEDVTEARLGLADWPRPDDACDVATFMARGAAVGDIDGDGDLDLFLPHPGGPDRLFVASDGRFVEVPFDGEGGSGALFFDADGDADLDLFVSSAGRSPPRMYEGDGRGGFVLRTDHGVVVEPDPNGCYNGFGVSAADLEGDGDLDLFTAAWVDADGSRVFENDGTGAFTDVTEQLGLDLATTAGLVPFPADLDDDGDLDYVLAADFDHTRHFVNRDGAFVDVTATSTLPRIKDAMSVASGDVDGDGDLDLFFSGICATVADTCNDAFFWSGNRLFFAEGPNHFVDTTTAAGVLDAGWAWGSAFFDADLDGDLDLAVTNGYEYLPRFIDDPVDYFENDGTGRFTERAAEVGLVDDRQTRAVLPFDLDDDGDLDVLVLAADGPPRLFENHVDGARNALTVRLVQDGPNPYAIGARVRVQLADGRWIRRDVRAATTYLSAPPPLAHFGLGSERAVAVEITWPDGAVKVERRTIEAKSLVLWR